MELTEVYKCLCDETRLRILHLLACRPLCVCHFQDILGAPQVRISKHLAYLRRHGMVEAHRVGAWMIYALPAHASPSLRANLKCLQECCRDNPVCKADLKKMKGSLSRCEAPEADCCAPGRSRTKTRAAR